MPRVQILTTIIPQITKKLILLETRHFIVIAGYAESSMGTMRVLGTGLFYRLDAIAQLVTRPTASKPRGLVSMQPQKPAYQQRN